MPAQMYKVATALNFKGNRRISGYTGEDQFLTNVDGDLKMMPESSLPGQEWLFTGEGCLKNGTGLYLTACPDKELGFLARSAAHCTVEYIHTLGLSHSITRA
tara:strand:- start:612 stop:917 length:306 start_codon:yes stop_codon:yes gene_type:complete